MPDRPTDPQLAAAVEMIRRESRRRFLIRSGMGAAALAFGPTLLAAMTGIARHVQDPEIRKILRETDGLGTEATRAGIIDLLFKRRFLVRQGKSIKATPTGRALILALPATATTPDMTALWEQHLGRIAERHASYQQFMGPLTDQLNALIEGARQDSGASFSALPKGNRSPGRC